MLAARSLRPAFAHVFRPPSPARARRALCPRGLSTPPAPTSPPPDVVLLSGGVESSTLLRHAARSSTSILPLFISYAQRAAAHELRASARQVALAQGTPGACVVEELLHVPLDGAGRALRGLAPSRRMHVPLPHRNLALVSLAVSVCAARRAGHPGGVRSRLYIALSKDDTAWYPSASAEFLRLAAEIAGVLEPGLEVRAPLVGMEKAEIVQRGVQLGVRWDTTYSCMLGGGKGVAEGELVHCGRCVQCVARKDAFWKAGVPDGTHGVYLR